MSLLTTWGYSLTDVNIIPDMMTLEEYKTMTGRNDDSARVGAEITAACSAIRNFIGWHLAPSLACELKMIGTDRRITRTHGDLMIQLPARYVSEITSVTVGGVEYGSYFADSNGILRVFNVPFVNRDDMIIVEYVAGISDAMIAPIKELIAHRVTHAIAVPAGITSEASGGVSVTYNATWINNSRATALAGDNKELLVPYKVQGVY